MPSKPFFRLLQIVALVIFAALPSLAAAQIIAPAPVPNTSERDDRPRPIWPERDVDVAYLSRDRAEFVVSGPISTAPIAIAALEDAGANLISSRDLVPLDRRMMVFDIGRQLDRGVAQRLLDRTASGHRVDFNNLYHFAQGAPRLYASNLIGDSGACRQRQNQKIGLIDGPVDVTHPALQRASVTTQSALFGDQRASGARHGTAVAALIVGEDPNDALLGYAPGAHLFAVNAFAREHSGVAADVDRIAASLSWMLSNDVHLINMSFAGPPNKVLEDILTQAEQAGAIMIAAAGNGGRDAATLPAVSPSVIAVTAVDAAMRRYRSANWGDHIAFAAPGVDIYVARPSGGGYATGTSYAAPIITALAARVGGNNVGVVRERLRTQAVDLGDPGHDPQYGWGLVRDIGC
ncbi:S8 family serine peptidase [Yoonia sp. I 8.24]|uniref:S8 family serine peptidase n=1 Tax=Yoonia sp. I 8.24 TaxID=1537229 RepID=UPI001EE13B98|nr:S8 family serine peptidase [Yoonia sp. I 8.24]MCG3267914.1 S8 family serine peptidase [Yoonia sp. I 8.24]